MDTRRSRSHGHICCFMATGLGTSPAFCGIHVQGYKLDFRASVVGIVVPRRNFLAKCFRLFYHRIRNNLIRQVIVYILLVILAVFAAAGAQILLKKGAMKEYAPFWKQYVNPWVISGYAIMGLSLLLNVFCLGRGVLAKEISTVESLSYLFVPCLSWFFFRERLSWRKAGAIAIILVGIVVFFI